MTANWKSALHHTVSFWFGRGGRRPRRLRPRKEATPDRGHNTSVVCVNVTRFYQIKRWRHIQGNSTSHYTMNKCSPLPSFTFPFLTAEKTTCQKALDRTAYATAKTTIACEYPDNDRSSVKFFCKKENGICEEIVSTRSSQKSKGKFTLSITGRGFDVSISNMSSQDNGVYWCGFKIGNDTSPGVGLRKIILKVQSEFLTCAASKIPSHTHTLLRVF